MGTSTSNLKDTITTIGGIIVLIAGAVNAYIQSIGTGQINWFQLGTAVVVAVIGYFTGKAPSGAAKTDAQVVAGNVTTPVPPASK